MSGRFRSIDGERAEIREPEENGAPDSVIRATPYAWRDPASIPCRQFVFGRHAIRKFVSVTGATGGVGKSSLAIVEALSVQTGRPLLNDGRIEHTRAWYIGLEDPQDEYDRRIAAAALLHRLPETALSGFFRDSARSREFVIAKDDQSGIVAVEPVVSAIISEIRKHDIGLVIVDPFVNCHEVNEQDNSKINFVARLWARVADETGCAVELNHHTRKGNGQGGEATADELRGAGALVGAARSVRLLAQMTAEEAKRADVDNRRRFFRVLTGVKANLTLHPEESVWRELVSIDLGNGNEFYPADHVQACAAWRFPDAVDDCSEEQLALILTRLSAGHYRESSQARDWAGNVVAEVLGLDIADEAAKASVKAALRKWMRDGTVKSVERKDDKSRKDFKFVLPANA